MTDCWFFLPVLLHQWLLSSEPFLIFIQSTWSFFSQPPVQELSYFILCGLIQQHSALSIGYLLKRQEVYSLNALYKADNEFCTFKQRQKPIITVGFLCAYWSGTWTRVVLVIPPNNKESQSQYQNATRMQMPFLSDHMLTTDKTWEFQRLLFAFSEECPLLPSLLKRFLHTKSKWCEFALVDIFSFCVLLTDWHLLSC